MRTMWMNKRRNHRAAAAVEMAVVTPILLTMLFGIVEFGWVFTVRQALETASREAARVAALPGSTDAEVQARAVAELAPLGLEGYTIELTRATPQDPTETVRVSIPYAQVSLVACYFGNAGGTLGASCSMRKEVL